MAQKIPESKLVKIREGIQYALETFTIEKIKQYHQEDSEGWNKHTPAKALNGLDVDVLNEILEKEYQH